MEQTSRSIRYSSQEEYVRSEDFARDNCFLEDETKLTADLFPEMTSYPAGMLYKFLPIPKIAPPSPEFVYIDRSNNPRQGDEDWIRHNFVFGWNLTWDAGTARGNMFPEKDVPSDLRWLLDTEANVRLVYRGKKHNYDAFAPLYHLLPRRTLDLFGLPCLHRGGWPMLTDNHLLENILPPDFDIRLQRAFAYHVWPTLNTRGVPTAYCKDEPIRVLAHNLDFWMPYLDLVAQRRIREFGRVDFEDSKQRAEHTKIRGKMPKGIDVERPLYGGPVWIGEKDASEATKEMVEFADSHGRLRGIIDAIKSNRIEDDFSSRWSFEREDFERKLYSKRNKIKVTFVQLDETVPVHGPESEVHESLLWEDFMAFLDEKERRIVVCLRNGVTKLGDIADTLGYRNHSPVSKRLSKIRRKAKVVLGL